MKKNLNRTIDECLNVIFKPTSCCNLHCKYCFAHAGRDLHRSMSDDEIYKSIIWIKDYAILRGFKAVHWLWHGGEPMLIGASKFEELTEYILDFFQQSGLKVYLSMQTNLTLVDMKWLNVFAKYYKDILGVSLDFGTNARVDINGKLYDNIVLNNIKYLRNNGIDISAVNTLVTPSNISRVREMYQFYKDNALYFQTSRYFPSTNPLPGETDFSVTDEEYYDFLKQLFDIWYNDDDPQIAVVNLKEMAVGLLNGYRKLCIASKNGCTQGFICIEAGGEIYNCGRYDTEEYCLGTINDNVSMVFEKILKRQRQILPVRCKSCKYYSLCFGGCRYERDTSGYNLSCNVDRKIFAYIENRLKESGCELALLKTAEELDDEDVRFE